MPLSVRRVFLVMAAAACLLVGACSATHTVVLKSDGSGTMALHMEVSRLLHDYVANLSEVSAGKPSSQGNAVFDLPAIRKGFEAQPGITVQKISSPDPRILDMEIAFGSLPDLFTARADLRSADVVSLSQADGLQTLRIHLDKSNYRRVAALFPVLETPILQSLGPQPDQAITDDDYLEMIRFSLGDEGPGLVKKSSLSITVAPEGDIVSQTGGTVSADTVVFKIPLLKLLVLNTPLDYSLTFRPKR